MSELSSNLCLEWKNLNYYVPLTQQSNYNFWQECRKVKELHLLKNVHGRINTGDLVAILGCSGAGKTTLLAAISQRLRGKVTGDVTLNGVAMNRSDMTRISSFLPQYDINVKIFTAYEHLYFMSHFKMHRKTTDAEKRQRVADLLFACGLKDVTHTRIQSLSGGERKRLSLAEELITDPPFLFCDEPTTGLDSYSAYRVIKTLRHLCTNEPLRKTALHVDNLSTPLAATEEKSYQNGMEMEMSFVDDGANFDLSGNLARNGELPLSMLNNGTLNTRQKKAIVCSVHQPSSELFELFTHIILMDEGRIIFQGSTEGASHFFTNLGYELPRNCNPADFYLKTISDSHTERKDGEFIKSKYDAEMCAQSTGNWLLPCDYDKDYLYSIKNIKKIRWTHQVYLLLTRLMIEDFCNLKDGIINLAIFMISTLTLAIMFSGIKNLTQTAVQDINGSIFMLPNEIVFPFSYGVAHTLPGAMPIMRREVGEGTYSLSAYYVAIVLSFIPVAFFKTFLFLSLIYGTIYYTRGFMLFLSMGFVLSLSAIAGTGYGLFISTLFETVTTASECAGPFDLFFQMLGGAFYNVDSIPLLKYLSLFFYVNEALFYTFWIDVDEIDCPANLENACVQNGLEVLQRNSYRTADYTYWIDCVGLLGLTVGFNIIAYSLIRKYVRRSGYY
ncbi:protein brown-like isoform X2 [Eurosta solidaginis]|uniref:protein brown-like isoform X2 n=1 Tax=Eurosta solidaginis TaxID=178769 RepID=UPI0035312B19